MRRFHQKYLFDVRFPKNQKVMLKFVENLKVMLKIATIKSLCENCIRILLLLEYSTFFINKITLVGGISFGR